MSYQEKRSIAALIGTMLLMSAYVTYILLRIHGGTLTWNADLNSWSKVMLIFMAISIGVMILIEITLAVINAALTRKKEDPDFSDERDKLIELKAVRVSYGVVGGGFILSIVALALQMTPFIMLNIMFLSCHTAEITGCIYKIYCHERGV